MLHFSAIHFNSWHTHTSKATTNLGQRQLSSQCGWGLTSAYTHVDDIEGTWFAKFTMANLPGQFAVSREILVITPVWIMGARVICVVLWSQLSVDVGCWMLVSQNRSSLGWLAGSNRSAWENAKVGLHVQLWYISSDRSAQCINIIIWIALCMYNTI